MKMRTVAILTLLAAAAGVPAAQRPTAKSGIDTAAFDTTVRPQDDLFRYVNGKWLQTTEIPADRPLYGTFVQLIDKAEKDLYLLIEELAGDPNKKPGSTAQQVGDLYASFTNEARIAQLGVSPLRPRLAEIQAITSTTELAQVLGRLSMMGLPGAVGGFVEADAGDPTKVALYLVQGGTALPDRDYYLVDNPKFAEIRQKYQAYLDERVHAGRPSERRGRREAGLRSRDRAREDPVDAGREPRRRQDLQQDGGREDRRGLPRLRLDGLGPRAGHRQSPRVGHQPAVVLQELRGDGAVDAARHVEGLAGGAAHHDAGAEPVAAVQRRGLRVLRQDAERPAGTAAAMEARRPARQRIARRGARPALRRAALPRHREDADGGDDPESDRGVPRLDHRARLDDAGDEEGSARQAREVHAEDRPPAALEGLLEARRQGRRSRRQRRAGQHARIRVPDRQALPPRRSRRVADDAADDQRVLQPGQERDRLSGRHSPAAVLRRHRGRCA